jgi:hypothetical protein
MFITATGLSLQLKPVNTESSTRHQAAEYPQYSSTDLSITYFSKLALCYCLFDHLSFEKKTGTWLRKNQVVLAILNYIIEFGGDDAIR